MVTLRSDPVSCTISLGFVLMARPAGGPGVGVMLGLTPSGFISNSSWTVRGTRSSCRASLCFSSRLRFNVSLLAGFTRSECRAADVVRLPLSPYGVAAVELHAALASCTRCWANQANVFKPFSTET